MGTDITTTGSDWAAYVVPDTGEVLDLASEASLLELAADRPDVLALVLESIDEAIRTAQDNRAWLAGFLLERMDRDATQTLHAGRYVVTVNGGSDEVETFDVDELRHGLERLVAAGTISAEAADRAVRAKYEVSKAGLNKLRARGLADIDAEIAKASSMAPRRRRVSVKRGG